MDILVTGGLGYIGSHFVIQALSSGFNVTVIDNLSNSSISIKNSIDSITKKSFAFANIDLRNKDMLFDVFRSSKFDLVVHFAGLKAVSDSCQRPLDYYENNVIGSWNLLQVMNCLNVKKIIFSSSATVYGMSQVNPLTEEYPKAPFNPYGQTKSCIEDMIADLCRSDREWSAVSLRYFNPIGAHPSGKIGENPEGVPNNLMPYIIKVAAGEFRTLQVFGSDYATPDGTGIRDFIHVLDLVDGHIKALKFLDKYKGYEVFNLGTGQGHSVLDIVKTFERVNHVKIPLMFKPRRIGDMAASWANPLKAEIILKWKAIRSLDEMVKDSWQWQKAQMDRASLCV